MTEWTKLLDPARRLFDTRSDELESRTNGEPIPLIASYGGGLNSTAGLVLFSKIGVRPDAILFADTAAEKPDTYAHVAFMSEWCASVGFPSITVVKRDCDHERQKSVQKYDTLEEECIAKKQLPSIAYFGRSCSHKWKHDPQNKWANHWPPAVERWKTGNVLKAIFFDADEPDRASVQSSKGYQNWYPLLDYDWGREECRQAIKLAGIPLPPKSCFFCSEMGIDEILELKEKHPELMARALAMEANARLTSIKGLGKHDYAWKDVDEGRVSLTMLPKRERERKCGCFDGDGPTLFDEE